MKKEEAITLAPERSRLICEYIQQFLSDNEKINGEIRIGSAKIDNQKMLTFDIGIPSKKFERHFSTGISVDHVDILTEQIFKDLTDNFLESPTIGCTKYYTIRGGYGMNMDGINAMNSIGSNIRINFAYRGQKFDEQVKEYNNKLDEYLNKQEIDQKTR